MKSLNLWLSRHLCYSIVIIITVIVSGMFNYCHAIKERRGKPPLIEEATRRKPISQTHCAFGNHTYAIEERWRPNLPPVGVYYCIRCECVAVQRKTRMVAKVRCKNFKNDCPKPTCDNPVLLPERCCKTCPGEDYAKLEEDFVVRKSENEELNLISSEPSHKCYYEGKIYQDGSQWKSENDDCEHCSCQRGRIICEQEACPKLNCSNPTKVPGDCCRQCNSGNNSTDPTTQQVKGCTIEGDKRIHAFGSSWHPYLPPFGFDKCSLCTCSAETQQVHCERKTSCPPLTCSEQEAYRENPMDCCKRCPNVLPVKSIEDNDKLGDQRLSGPKDPNELLATGGCKFKGRVFENGDEWHPTVQPFGEFKCVKCRCKDGVHKCKRINCPKITACSIVINKNNECCPICADTGDDLMMKNQPFNMHPRRKAKRRKGRILQQQQQQQQQQQHQQQSALLEHHHHHHHHHHHASL